MALAHNPAATPSTFRLADLVSLVSTGFRRLSEEVLVTRDDRQIFGRIQSDFAELQTQLRSIEFATDDAYFAALYAHLLRVVDATATLLTTSVRSEAAIAIKLLWADQQGFPRVRTFVRDKNSQGERAEATAPNLFPVSDNTAFDSIAYQKTGGRYFGSDNLSALEASGGYRNSRESWPHYYNTTAVMGVPFEPERALVAFLCADTRYGAITAPRATRTLEIVSSYVYSIFGLSFEAQCRFLRKHTSEELRSIDASTLEIGWTIGDGHLVRRNPTAQSIFQRAVEHLEESYFTRHPNDAPVGTSPRIKRGGAGARRPENGGEIMNEADRDPSDLLADSDLDPKRVEAIEQILNEPDQQFFTVLAKVASGNPHAEAMVDAAKKKGWFR